MIKSIKNKVQILVKKGILPYRFFELPFWLPKSDTDKLLGLKNKFLGERCFIIGNGPSLNLIDLKKLKGEYSFGVNSIFYKEEEGFRPYFYTVEDSHVIEDNLYEICNFATQYKFIPTEYKHLIDRKFYEDIIFFPMNTGFYQTYSPNHETPRFSDDITKQIFCGQSVTIINLQLAFYMGFKYVYLVGMDFSYKIPESAIINGASILSTEDDENHFDPRYFGAGKKWHDPKLHNVFASYQLCKKRYFDNSRAIYNATKGGKLEIFDRVDFDELF